MKAQKESAALSGGRDPQTQAGGAGDEIVDLILDDVFSIIEGENK